MNRPATAVPKNRELPSKESTQFKSLLRYFEHKQYKKGLKTADGILKKYPNHGETLSMKGLFLSHMDKKEEAYDHVKLGLRNDLTSHICWHVYGLLYRSDKNYEEASKCYTHALKYDKENLQILRDYSLMQIQMRNYEAFNESRYQLLTLKSNLRPHWISFSISYFLLGKYDMALQVLNTYEETAEDEWKLRGSKTRPDGKRDVEWSEMMLYKALVMQKMEDYESALTFLDKVGKWVCDTIGLLEMKASILISLNRKSEAQKIYSKLISMNPDNHSYIHSYFHSLSIFPSASPSILESGVISSFLHQIDTFLELYPRSNYFKYLTLLVLPVGSHTIRVRDGNDNETEKKSDVFRERVHAYLRHGLRKGIPSLFVGMKHIYVSDPQKIDVIQGIVHGFLENLESLSKFEDNESEESEPPSAKLWVLYYLAQHYDNLGKHEKALGYINAAIEHTPTLVELYMTKGRIYKHAGDQTTAASCLDRARELDFQDRFINTKCVKYFIRNDQLEKAEEMAGLFTRAEATSPLQDLTDMQCSWYTIETGLSFVRQNLVGRALKRLLNVEKFFFDMTDDQFDFHTYAIRKMTLRSYIEMLEMEDRLRAHPFYFEAAKTIIECYIRLFDNPKDVKQSQEANGAANLSAAELKKLRPKQRKAELKSQSQTSGKDDKENKPDSQIDKKDTKKDDDPNGQKLLETKDPLGEANKFLHHLMQLSPGRIETWALAAKVYRRLNKPLLVLRVLKKAFTIDSTHPDIFLESLRFLISGRCFLRILNLI
ncbi:NMDA receptor-regulated protein 1-domain-containing protein [Paraphysoderma sedebokerense]|nr:NMDA receptor-regulated protein 1-domain-containing protein [Paraphysoderma sedebokerense]